MWGNGLRASYLPPVSLGFHSVGDFNEAGNIGAREQAGKDIVGELFTRPLASCSQANLRPTFRLISKISTDEENSLRSTRP